MIGKNEKKEATERSENIRIRLIKNRQREEKVDRCRNKKKDEEVDRRTERQIKSGMARSSCAKSKLAY